MKPNRKPKLYLVTAARIHQGVKKCKVFELPRSTITDDMAKQGWSFVTCAEKVAA